LNKMNLVYFTNCLKSFSGISYYADELHYR